MDENALHQWMLEAFGPFQGEQAWRQFQQLPDDLKRQLMESSASGLPDPGQMRSLFNALSTSGLGSMTDMRSAMKDGPIIVDFAKALADGKVQSAQDYQPVVNGKDAEDMRSAISEANLWLDSTMAFDPAPGTTEVWSREQWVGKTLPGWAKIATPVVSKLSQSLSDVLRERLGDHFDGKISGVFAGPVSLPIPQDMDAADILRFVGSLSFSLQLGSVAGDMASEVHGSYDQGLPMAANPAGALIVQNAKDYAAKLELDEHEVMQFLALIEIAHARLFSAVAWLPSRFETLIYKYSRSIAIDPDLMETELRDADSMDPEALSGAVNLSRVGADQTPEQQEVLGSIENLLALVEGWVDCVVWRAGMAHLPHLDQLLEMRRRERVEGGPAEQTLESLLGLRVHPRTMRQAAKAWEQLTAQGIDERDSHWRHPDFLPQIPSSQSAAPATPDGAGNGGGVDEGDPRSTKDAPAAGKATADSTSASVQSDGDAHDGTNGASSAHSIDWDAELAKLLDDVHGDDGDADDTGDPGDLGDPSDGEDGAGGAGDPPAPPVPPAPPADMR